MEEKYNLARFVEAQEFGAYDAALHQLYLAGMAVELNALGYHMAPLN